MVLDYKKLLQSLNAKQFAPVYLIDGDEPYYLDAITDWVETNVLQPAERDFNLTVLYGKDAEWADVVNACRRFPMFAERQVVILKDAAQMRSFAELAGYVERPSPTTLFLIEHRGKKADGRSKLLKEVKDKGVYFTSEKIKDEHIPHWIERWGAEHNMHIGHQEAEALTSALGNDLQKIVNELSKVRLNMPEGAELTAALIQKYIGVSREYNIFEYPKAITSGDKDRLYKMLSYFTANPKSAPLPLLIGSFYAHLERMYLQTTLRGKSDKEIAALLQLSEKDSWKTKSYREPMRHTPEQVEAAILLLAEYSGKAVGVGANIPDSAWVKELTARMEGILG